MGIDSKHFLVLISILQFFTLKGFASEINPYAPPPIIEGDRNSKKLSCAYLAYSLELTVFDKDLWSFVSNLRKLDKRVVVVPGEFSKSNGRNRVFTTTFFLNSKKSNLNTFDVLTSLELKLTQFNPIVRRLSESPFGNIDSKGFLRCMKDTCFRSLRFGSISFLVTGGVKTVLDLQIPTGGAIVAFSTIAAGAALGGATATVAAGIKDIWRSDEKIYRQTLEDIKKFAESTEIANQNNHFIIISKMQSRD